MSTPYVTDRERRQHDADGGLTAALAIAHQLMAAECRDLPDGLVATPANQYFYATTGSAEERRAVVNAWAAAHHVKAGWDDNLHRYCARVPLGLSSMLAIAVEATA